MRNCKTPLILLAALLWPTVALGGDGGFCLLISDAISGGKNSTVVVRSAIELGHNACLVVQCALEAGGDPQEVVAGAIAAGAVSAVVSRCAINAGLEPEQLARIIAVSDLSLSFCYFPPAESTPERGNVDLDLPGIFDPIPPPPPRRDISIFTF